MHGIFIDVVDYYSKLSWFLLLSCIPAECDTNTGDDCIEALLTILSA